MFSDVPRMVALSSFDDDTSFLSTFLFVKNAYLLIYNCWLPTEELWHVVACTDTPNKRVVTLLLFLDVSTTNFSFQTYFLAVTAQHLSPNRMRWTWLSALLCTAEIEIEFEEQILIKIECNITSKLTSETKFEKWLSICVVMIRISNILQISSSSWKFLGSQYLSSTVVFFPKLSDKSDLWQFGQQTRALVRAI